MNEKKSNNIQDALIAETSIKEGHVLVTDDTDLARVMKEFGGRCLSVAEFLRIAGGFETSYRDSE